MVRCLLVKKKLLNEFWVKAAYTAVYLQNRLPTAAVKDLTPIEAWSGVRPSVKHMKVFGACCYVRIPTEKRSKLDVKSQVGIFLGYEAKSKGYRVYNLKDKKIVISRDVIVDEDSFRNWEKNEVQQGKEGNQSDVLATNQGEMDKASLQAETDDPDEPIKGKTKSLAEIYEKCNVALVEPSSYEEETRYEGWVQAMEEEIHMIQKNKT